MSRFPIGEGSSKGIFGAVEVAPVSKYAPEIVNIGDPGKGSSMSRLTDGESPSEKCFSLHVVCPELGEGGCPIHDVCLNLFVPSRKIRIG